MDDKTIAGLQFDVPSDEAKRVLTQKAAGFRELARQWSRRAEDKAFVLRRVKLLSDGAKQQNNAMAPPKATPDTEQLTVIYRTNAKSCLEFAEQYETASKYLTGNGVVFRLTQEQLGALYTRDWEEPKRNPSVPGPMQDDFDTYVASQAS